MTIITFSILFFTFLNTFEFISGQESHNSLQNIFIKFQDQIVAIPNGDDKEVSFYGNIMRFDFKNGNFQGLLFECDSGKQLYFSNGRIRTVLINRKDKLINEIIAFQDNKSNVEFKTPFSVRLEEYYYWKDHNLDKERLERLKTIAYSTLRNHFKYMMAFKSELYKLIETDSFTCMPKEFQEAYWAYDTAVGSMEFSFIMFTENYLNKGSIEVEQMGMKFRNAKLEADKKSEKLLKICEKYQISLKFLKELHNESIPSTDKQKSNENIFKFKKLFRKYQDQLIGIHKGDKNNISLQGNITNVDFDKGLFTGLTFEDEEGVKRCFSNGGVRWISFKGKDKLISELGETTSGCKNIIQIVQEDVIQIKQKYKPDTSAPIWKLAANYIRLKRKVHSNGTMDLHILIDPKSINGSLTKENLAQFLKNLHEGQILYVVLNNVTYVRLYIYTNRNNYYDGLYTAKSEGNPSHTPKISIDMKQLNKLNDH